MNEYLTPQSPRAYCEIHGDISVRIKKDTVGPHGIEPYVVKGAHLRVVILVLKLILDIVSKEVTTNSQFQ